MKKANKLYDDYRQKVNDQFKNLPIIRFVRILREKNTQTDKLFDQADKDGGGNIDLLELKDCLKLHGGFTEKELYSIMKYMDVDGDGTIDKKEFIS